MYYSSLKKHSPSIVFIFIAILLFMFFGLSACSKAPEKLPELLVEGAIQPVPDNNLILKAYKPDIEIKLDWQDSSANSIELIIKNINTSKAQIDMDSNIDQQKANFKSEILSETELILKISGGKGKQYINITTIPSEYKQELCFAIIGDSQGRNDTLGVIIEEINQTEAGFLVFLGDMVPSGTAEEFSDFISTMENLTIPYYTIPGNHDVRHEGLKHYLKLFAPAYYHFDYNNLRFILLDNSTLGLDDEQLKWLQETISGTQNISLLFKHVPIKDPRGLGHSFIDPLEAERFMDLIASNEHKIGGLFAGHIHMFYEDMIDNIPLVISGGGGAPLYAKPEEGGYNHFALVRIDVDGIFQVEPIPVEAPNVHLDISILGRDGETVFTASELKEMATITREGGFQNVHGNYRGHGVYRGVPIGSLVETVGGMEPGDQLNVISLDGYSQIYDYKNIYPQDFGWYEYQGDMVLAIEYDGTAPPEWQDGYRVIFLPEDGMFDNDDCLQTSAPGYGCHVYESAGSRWVKMVTRLEVIFNHEY